MSEIADTKNGNANPLEKARQIVKNRIANGLKAYKTPLEKHQENQKSLRYAINAKCYECMGCDKSHREWIRDCTSYSCPLYSVRPYQSRYSSTPIKA